MHLCKDVPGSRPLQSEPASRVCFQQADYDNGVQVPEGLPQKARRFINAGTILGRAKHILTLLARHVWLQGQHIQSTKFDDQVCITLSGIIAGWQTCAREFLMPFELTSKP